MQEPGQITFGPFGLDPVERVVRRAGTPIPLTPRTVEVLLALVERHGQVVDKGWIFDHVWRGVCVEECNLAQHVSTLRRALGDHAREPAYIETIPRRGYRFVAPVVRLPSSPSGSRDFHGSLPEPSEPPSPTPLPSAARRRRPAATGEARTARVRRWNGLLGAMGWGVVMLAGALMLQPE